MPNFSLSCSITIRNKILNLIIPNILLIFKINIWINCRKYISILIYNRHRNITKHNQTKQRRIYIFQSIKINTPLADGNPDSRVYAYEVVVIGEAGSRKLFKAVYAAGCNMGIGHETNGGVTTLEIAKDELPSGESLTFAVRPLTSLGTSGRPIITDFKV